MKYSASSLFPLGRQSPQRNENGSQLLSAGGGNLFEAAEELAVVEALQDFTRAGAARRHTVSHRTVAVWTVAGRLQMHA